MTVASTLNRVAYTGNGATTAFAVSFPFQSATDLVVVETIIATGVQTTKTITTHYTVSGTPDSLGYYPNGGTVTAVTAPASTVTWTIYRDPDMVQSLNLSESNALPAESLEAQLDYLTMLVQRLSDRVNRSLRQPEGDSADIDLVPSKVDRASLYLAFDADGDPIATAGTTSAYVVTPFMETVLDDTTAAAVRSTLGLHEGISTGTIAEAKGDLLVATAADTVARKAVGNNGASLRCDSAQSDGHSYGALAGYKWGLTLSNNGSDATNDIDIAVGEASNSSTAYSNRVVMALTSGLTKKLDATWAAGTDQGGRASSQAIANGTWHVFLMRVAGVDDVGFDTSVTGANLITDHSATHVRRIGSILRESAAIVAFVQDGNYFRRKGSVLDISATNPGTSAVTGTLSVPTGLNLQALLNAYLTASGGGASVLVLSDLAANNEAPSSTASPLGNIYTTAAANYDGASGLLRVRTNASAQVRYRVSYSDASIIVRIATLGWIDSMGTEN